MTNDDIVLIRKIVAGGGRRGGTSAPVDPSRYQRLVDLGWVDAFPPNMSKVGYVATEAAKEVAKIEVIIFPPKESESW